MEQNAFQQAVIAAAQQLGLADYELYFQFADGISVDIFGRDEIREACAFGALWTARWAMPPRSC